MQTFSPLSRSLLMLTAQLSKCINRHQHGRKHGSSSQAQWEFSRGSKIQGLTTPLLPKLTYQMRNSGQTLTYKLSVWIEKKEQCWTKTVLPEKGNWDNKSGTSINFKSLCNVSVHQKIIQESKLKSVLKKNHEELSNKSLLIRLQTGGNS